MLDSILEMRHNFNINLEGTVGWWHVVFKKKKDIWENLEEFEFIEESHKRRKSI